MSSQHVLIIKTGESEFLTSEETGGASLGDVFRVTCILQEFHNDHVTWVTNERAVSLLPDTPLVDRTIALADDGSDQKAVLDSLCHERFDSVINLERLDVYCEWAEKIAAASPGAKLYQCCQRIFHDPAFARWETFRDLNRDSAPPPSPTHSMETPIPFTNSYQYYLFLSMNLPWRGQPYAIPRAAYPLLDPTLDVGFNHAVGPKWPVKAWPMSHWEQLATLCENADVSHSFQEGFDNLSQYAHWIQKHRVIVTSDSLGLHLALALGRSVVGLFGPTRYSDIYFYRRGEGISAESRCPKLPCFQHECDFSEHCMQTISPSAVFDRLATYL